jgi:hypothetical protein
MDCLAKVKQMSCNAQPAWLTRPGADSVNSSVFAVYLLYGDKYYERFRDFYKKIVFDPWATHSFSYKCCSPANKK